MNRQQLEEYIAGTYAAVPEHPWEQYPGYTVFRHQSSKKWFALIMEIPRSRLGLPGDAGIEVLNIKCDPLLIGSLRLEKGFFPAYHMNKESWITAALDGSIDKEKLKFLLELSYELTSPRKPAKRRK